MKNTCFTVIQNIQVDHAAACFKVTKEIKPKIIAFIYLFTFFATSTKYEFRFVVYNINEPKKAYSLDLLNE